MGKQSNTLSLETESRNSQNTQNNAPGSGKTFTREEVAKHNTEESSYIIINNSVYDITQFSSLHVCFLYFYNE